MNKLRIVIIIGKFPCLSETFILNPIIQLIKLGHDVRVLPLSPEKESQTHPDFLDYDLTSKTLYPIVLSKSKWGQRFKTLFHWSKFFFQRPTVAFRILKANLGCPDGFSHKRCLFSIQLFQQPYDLVHCHFGPNASDIVQLKKAGLKIPLITSFHGYDINSYPLTAGKDCYKDLFDTCELYTANTNFTKQQVALYGCDPSKIHIVHESLNCDKFYFNIDKKHSPQETIKTLTVGRMVEKKGYAYSLQAIGQLINKGIKIEYWAVGDGPLLSDMKDLASQLKISSHVKFFGALQESDIINLYRQADLFILPSVTAANGDKEGQGLVLQEAQMSGLPLVSTLHNGIPDGVLDGQSGFLVPEKDVDALAEKIEYLITHPETWKSFGETGQAFVQKTFDVTCVVDSMLKVYYMADSTPKCN
jgi:colanic acid/amylovoran biosynthesis glycosyltransferase